MPLQASIQPPDVTPCPHLQPGGLCASLYQRTDAFPILTTTEQAEQLYFLSFLLPPTASHRGFFDPTPHATNHFHSTSLSRN